MPDRAPQVPATAAMAPPQGALPLLRAATHPNAVSGALDTPRWVNWGPPVRRPMLAHTRSRDAMATPCWGASPGVLALALGGMLAQQDRAAVGLQADRLIGRSSAHRDARSASLEDAPGATAALGGRQVVPAGHWASAPGWNRGR
jgi:hypothetical protein